MSIGSSSQDVFLRRKGNPTYPFWFKGIMDDIRIYNRAINCAEVDSLHNSCPPAVIISQPKHFTVCESGSARFFVTASASSNYQWQVKTDSTWSDVTNNSTYSGATSNTLNLTGVTALMNNYQYRVVASNLCGTVTSSAASLSFAEVNLTNGLIAHYPFNGNANDISGNGYNPVFNNAVLTAGRDGAPNTAYYFNGSNSYMKIANNAALSPQELTLYAGIKPMGFIMAYAITIALWIKGLSIFNQAIIHYDLPMEHIPEVVLLMIQFIRILQDLVISTLELPYILRT